MFSYFSKDVSMSPVTSSPPAVSAAAAGRPFCPLPAPVEPSCSLTVMGRQGERADGA